MEVPTLLIPVAAEFPVVAPLMDQVSEEILQLSAVVGLLVATDAVQPARNRVKSR